MCCAEARGVNKTRTAFCSSVTKVIKSYGAQGTFFNLHLRLPVFMVYGLIAVWKMLHKSKIKRNIEPENTFRCTLERSAEARLHGNPNIKDENI